MKSKLLYEHGGNRTFVIVFERGESVMEPLVGFLKTHSVSAARLTGIGALESITLGYFDWKSKEYERHTIDEQVELLSLAGDVALSDDVPQVHAHATRASAQADRRGDRTRPDRAAALRRAGGTRPPIIGRLALNRVPHGAVNPPLRAGAGAGISPSCSSIRRRSKMRLNEACFPFAETFPRKRLVQTRHKQPRVYATACCGRCTAHP
jgi:predicted DNA-binding protein with PD1-like motif